MKYTLIAVAVATTVTVWCYAQDTNAISKNKSGFYVVSGVSVSTISLPAAGMIQSAKSIVTPGFGVVADVRLTRKLSLNTGLHLISNGAKIAGSTRSIDSITVTDTAKFSPRFIRLPVMISYKFFIASNFTIYAAIGPYVARGFTGKTERKITINGIKTSIDKDIIFNSDPTTVRSKEGLLFAQVNPYDYGISSQIGFDIKKFLVNVNLAMGLSPVANVVQQGDNNGSYRYKTITISIGRKI